MRERRAQGIPVAPAVVEQLRTLAAELRVSDRLE